MTDGSQEGAAAEEKFAAQALELTRKLEATFGMIERERMGGVPILNPALRVAAVGMRAHGQTWACGLVTPWFINLMLLPGTPELAAAWSGFSIGTKVSHDFPAGTFEFLCGADEALGPYRMCSLFSPVLEFENQEAALAAAEAAMGALFEENLDAPREQKAAPPRPAKDAGQLSRRTLFLGRKA